MDKDDMTARVKGVQIETLHRDGGIALKRASYDYRRENGAWQTQVREAYDIGDGAAILPYDKARGLVLLIRQFRWPCYAWGWHDFLIEAVAGKLDGDDPTTCVVREAMEEAGVTVRNPKCVFYSFLSPGRVQERLSLFVAEYDSTAPRAKGGGLEQEGEDIQVLEITLTEAMAMIARGEIVDGKTIMLLQWVSLGARSA